VRVQCRRKESSRSLSHLMMSILFIYGMPVGFLRLFLLPTIFSFDVTQ